MPKPGTISLNLQGSLGLRDVPRLVDELRGALASGKAVKLDATDLADADIAVLQLLVSARKTADAAGQSVTLFAPGNRALTQLLAKAGFLGPGGEPRSPAEDFWKSGDSARAGEAA